MCQQELLELVTVLNEEKAELERENARLEAALASVSIGVLKLLRMCSGAEASLQQMKSAVTGLTPTGNDWSPA